MLLLLAEQHCTCMVSCHELPDQLQGCHVWQVVTLHHDGEGTVIEDPAVIGEGGLLQEHLAAFRLCPEGYRYLLSP